MNKEKNLAPKEGYRNRHIDGLPTERTIMRVITKDVDGEHIYLCEFEPPSKDYRHHEGYLGTARVIKSNGKGIGFHAWEENDWEFVYYQIV